MIRILLLCLLSAFMIACTVTTKPPKPMPPPHKLTLVEKSELQQGKRFFNDGYYKRAMHQLLPLACDGVPEAQYAVGYMYYYGLGVAQDTDVGYFWIERSAKQQFLPAVDALQLINSGKNTGDKVPRSKGLTMTQ